MTADHQRDHGRLRLLADAAGGFTLVEVLIAVAITAVVMVETAAVFRTATDSHRRLTDTTLA
ncbi:MAG: prepilin-type N-terminal cleavage/methylation domain-containing protein, partial [Planctomycetes bacterium]|nr:prepilin-type N-terminal cleavage/methylation domain-containing protein [Planctomycetota bacterium]